MKHRSETNIPNVKPTSHGMYNRQTQNLTNSIKPSKIKGTFLDKKFAIYFPGEKSRKPTRIRGKLAEPFSIVCADG